MGAYWEGGVRLSDFWQAVGELVYAAGHLGCGNPDVYFRRVVLMEKSQPLPAGHVGAPDAHIGSLDSAGIWDWPHPGGAGHVWICAGAALVRAALGHWESLALFAGDATRLRHFCLALRNC